ncbi:MAG: nucleotidyltransferase domain-containing protein [Paenibacillaceae bacterium]
MRLQPIDVANQFIDLYFPNCRIAFLAGSASRGEHKPSSDLDIVVIDETQPNAYRESFFKFGWRIEAFIHTKDSYRPYFESDKRRWRPTLPNMIFSGLILKDDGTAQSLKKEAQQLLEDGPETLTPEDISASRYFLTDLLDDFIDTDKTDEALITLNTLSLQVAEFILRSNRKWIGRGKGLVRELRQFDESLCDRFMDSLQSYYQDGNKQPFTEFVDDLLDPHGGRLFEGFSMGKLIR